MAVTAAAAALTGVEPRRKKGMKTEDKKRKKEANKLLSNSRLNVAERVWESVRKNVLDVDDDDG